MKLPSLAPEVVLFTTLNIKYSLRISFTSLEIRKICENAEHATTTLGTAVAVALQLRLADLMSTPTIGDLPKGIREVVKKESDSLSYIDLAENFKLFFTANHTRKSPKEKDGNIDWDSVSYIQILEIKK